MPDRTRFRSRLMQAVRLPEPTPPRSSTTPLPRLTGTPLRHNNSLRTLRSRRRRQTTARRRVIPRRRRANQRNSLSLVREWHRPTSHGRRAVTAITQRRPTAPPPIPDVTARTAATPAATAPRRHLMRQAVAPTELRRLPIGRPALTTQLPLTPHVPLHPPLRTTLRPPPRTIRQEAMADIPRAAAAVEGLPLREVIAEVIRGNTFSQRLSAMGGPLGRPFYFGPANVAPLAAKARGVSHTTLICYVGLGSHRTRS